ncbi:MAG TPA: hypothetical protein P5277_01995 [Candidatus Paceibacterota bacterium]|nr:hypothetical protein [Candidatus Paceibacterota bacterium]
MEETKKIKIEKYPAEKIKGRVIILNVEQSEFAKNLCLNKQGDYAQKNK